MHDKTTLSLMGLCLVLLMIIVFGTTCGRKHYRDKVYDEITKRVRAEAVRDSAKRVAAHHQEVSRLILEGYNRSVARLDSAKQNWKDNPTAEHEEEQGRRLTDLVLMDSTLRATSGEWSVPE